MQAKLDFTPDELRRRIDEVHKIVPPPPRPAPRIVDSKVEPTRVKRFWFF